MAPVLNDDRMSHLRKMSASSAPASVVSEPAATPVAAACAVCIMASCWTNTSTQMLDYFFHTDTYADFACTDDAGHLSGREMPSVVLRRSRHMALPVLHGQRPLCQFGWQDVTPSLPPSLPFPLPPSLSSRMAGAIDHTETMQLVHARGALLGTSDVG